MIVYMSTKGLNLIYILCDEVFIWLVVRNPRLFKKGEYLYIYVYNSYASIRGHWIFLVNLQHLAHQYTPISFNGAFYIGYTSGYYLALLTSTPRDEIYMSVKDDCLYFCPQRNEFNIYFR